MSNVKRSMISFLATYALGTIPGWWGAPGVDVRRAAGDRAVLARGPRVPQDDALLLPRRHRPRRQPQQRAPRRGLARRLEAFLLQY